MASLLELSRRYNTLYAFWCFVEYHTDLWGKSQWLNTLAKKEMNRISMRLKGKEVFSLEQ